MNPNTAYMSGLLWIPHRMFDLRQLKATLTFVPASTVGKPKPLRAWADAPNHIGVPRYTLGDPNSFQFRKLFIDAQIPLVDERPTVYEDVDIRSLVQLDGHIPGSRQREAVKALMEHEDGILVLACGMGKSVLSLHAAAQFRSPFIIVVNNKGLQEQWIGETEKFLADRNGNNIKVGRVGDGKKEWDRPIVVALIQSLAKHAKDVDMPTRRRFAVSIWDECDMMGSSEYSKVGPMFSGRRWGLSATPRRADGMEQLYYLHLGRPIYEDLHQDLPPRFAFYRVKTMVNKDDPTYRAYVLKSGQTDVSALFTYLAGQRSRTAEIAELIRKGVQAKRKIMVVSRRLMLLDELHRMFPEAGKITGKITGTTREQITRNRDLILAQHRLGEKGMNKPELDMLIVCEPVKRREVFQQLIGRVQRSRPGKPMPLVVFVEDPVGACLGMCRGIKRMITTWPEKEGGPYKWSYLED